MESALTRGTHHGSMCTRTVWGRIADMHLIRARLTMLGVWLIACQISNALVAPIALYTFNAHKAPDSVSCTCNHVADTQCPMHSHAQTSKTSSQGSRWCDGAHDNLAIALTGLAGFGAVPTARHQIAMPSIGPESLFFTGKSLAEFTATPRFPPPRV